MLNHSRYMQLTNHEKIIFRQKISDYARELGFDLVGFSPAKIEEKYLAAFEKWLQQGREGNMEYMKKIAERRDLTKILPGAKSVIVFGLNYYHQQTALKRGHGRVARYAYGRDYHKVIGKKLKKVEEFIAEMFSVPTKSYVDTGPLLERALAEQAGLGRIGKNGSLITEKFGSWVFLGEIITTLDLNIAPQIPISTGRTGPASQSVKLSTSLAPASIRQSHLALTRWSDPAQKSFNICGNCHKCMSACPTGAIVAPGVIDARLCISYLTIENKKKIPPKLAKIIKKTKRLYGCDLCQEVCPHNTARQHVRTTHGTTDFHDGLFTPIAGDSLSIKKLLAKKTAISPSPLSSDAAFLQAFAGSPVMRAKRRGLKRNAKIF